MGSLPDAVAKLAFISTIFMQIGRVSEKAIDLWQFFLIAAGYHGSRIDKCHKDDPHMSWYITNLCPLQDK